MEAQIAARRRRFSVDLTNTDAIDLTLTGSGTEEALFFVDTNRDSPRSDSPRISTVYNRWSVRKGELAPGCYTSYRDDESQIIKGKKRREGKTRGARGRKRKRQDRPIEGNKEHTINLVDQSSLDEVITKSSKQNKQNPKQEKLFSKAKVSDSVKI